MAINTSDGNIDDFVLQIVNNLHNQVKKQNPPQNHFTFCLLSIKPKFKLLDWFDCSAFDGDEESIIDYPSKAYVNEWFEIAYSFIKDH